MKIERYSKKYSGDFEHIWVDWLKNSMGINPQKEDLEEVQNPYESYVNSGGMAFYAIKNNQCFGVIAVKKLNKYDYEFCKLVVVENARGLGLGKELVQSSIDFVKNNNGKSLYLQSFYKLKVALAMYKSMGFIKAIAPKEMNVVDRTEIIMKIKIN